ncbi:MAG: hypothetical protein ACLFWD_02965 [Anaerolineales bacterium]
MGDRNLALMLVVGLIAIIASACGASPGAEVELPEAEQARQAVRQQLQQEMSVAPDRIEILDAEQVAWTNECLELPEPNEVCAEVVTSGWLMQAQVGDQRVEVHTDFDASDIRIQGLQSENLAPEVAVEAQRFLSENLQIEIVEIELIASERVDWSDACLGLGGPEEGCAQVVTPGWRFTFEVNGEQYEVRTDELGETIRLAQ